MSYPIIINLVTSYYDYLGSLASDFIVSSILLGANYDSEGNVFCTVTVSSNNNNYDVATYEINIGTTTNDYTWEDVFNALETLEYINIAIVDSENYHGFFEGEDAQAACISPYFTILNCYNEFTNQNSTLDLEEFINIIERVAE